MTKENEIYLYSMPNLGCLLGSAYQHQLTELATALSSAGLNVTTAEYLVLRALYTRDGMQQCEIASLIGKDKGAVCRTVTSMEKKGLVTTRAVSHKCRQVYLSAYGKAIESTIMKVAEKQHGILTSKIPQKEMKAFVNVLKLIIEH